MTLVNDMQRLKDDLLRLPREFGLPQYRRLAVRKRSPQSTLYDRIISPTPKTVNLNARQIAELMSKETVQVSTEDFWVKHLSRVNYTREFLLDDIDFYILDYSSQSNGTVSGIRCKPVFLDESKATSYSLAMKRMGDREVIERVGSATYSSSNQIEIEVT
jgi:virulence-associated protein VagC